MATRSMISLKIKDGYESIYCHWDGYPDHQLPLLKHYDNLEKVQLLMDLGDLSSLNKYIGEKHDFNFHHTNPNAQDWCLSFGRDRGEEDVSKKFSLDKEALIKLAGQMDCRYLYVFINKKWNWEKV